MDKKLDLLVVDDDKDFIEDFTILAGSLFNVTSVLTGEDALGMLASEAPDAVILDLRLGSGIDGLETLKRIRNMSVNVPVIIVTDYAAVDTAVEAMKLGAFHYMSKHPNMKELYAIIRRELKYAGWRSLYFKEVRRNYGTMVGKSAGMKEVFGIISKAAPVDISVTIEGESGTGKELVAREIHGRSRRVHNPLIAVNCAAIPDTLFESTMFGHEKGAFTNAVCRRKGHFEAADNSTIFLDEIGSLSRANQAKLLRVIEEKRFVRVGGTDDITVNCRIVAASNKNLKEEVDSGAFREDLFYRISGIVLHLPPLRERKSDILLLAAHFARKISLETCRKCPDFTEDAKKMLYNYTWPGNVRELKNVIERSVVLVQEPYITAKDLHLLPYEATTGLMPANTEQLTYAEAKHRVMTEFKKHYVAAVLKKYSGNVTAASKAAGISRSSFHRMIKGG